MKAKLAPGFEQTLPVYRQITDRIRRLIQEDDLSVGERLPSTHALASQWGTNAKTVQQGLAPLVKEGFLTRIPKRGTFVRQREEKLTCVGVFDSVGINDSLYGQAVHKALKEELHQAGMEMDVWLDPRPEKEFAEPWLPFWHAATHREFQAVIVTGMNPRHMQWQRKLPVPTVFQGETGNVPHYVGWDLEQFAECSLQALAQQGCRSVGLIAPFWREGIRWVEHFREASRRLGLTLKEEWARLPLWAGDKDMGGGAWQERFGHEQFLRLWAQPQRPDGVVVYPDIVARGVILGLLEKQVRVPEDLKLALHKNEAVDLYCPLPATFVVSSEAVVARALITQVQKQFRGETCEPISLPFRLMVHSGSSPQLITKTQEGSQL